MSTGKRGWSVDSPGTVRSIKLHLPGGWQSVPLAEPLDVFPGREYVVDYVPGGVPSIRDVTDEDESA
jgi:hypothetical protein